MLNYYLNHKDKPIYKKTDYLCNEKEKLCICNIHAEDFEKFMMEIIIKKDINILVGVKKSKIDFNFHNIYIKFEYNWYLI